MVGIRPSPQLNDNRIKSGQAPKPPSPPKRFAFGKAGELKKEFKPLVSKTPSKDRGIDR